MATQNIYSLTDVWNSAGTTFTGIGLSVTDTASASGSLLFNLQIASASIFNVSKTGAVQVSARSAIRSPSDGVFTVTNAANTDFGRLQFGGTTSAFPAISRAAFGFLFRLADDSAYTFARMETCRLNSGTILGDTGDGNAYVQNSSAVPGTMAGANFISSSTTAAIRTSGALANGAAAQVATMTNGPTAGNPTKWIPIDDNGTTRYIPAW